MPSLRSPEDFLATELKEIHSAERQLTRAIPRMAKRVTSDRLREMLDQRCEQGEELIEQLDQALDEMEVSKGRQKNIAAEGLIEDTQQHLDEVEDDRLVDPLLLASVQKIEHYCIAAWSSARSMGELLGQDKVVKTMEQVLDDGKRYDDELTELAEKEINPQMLRGEEQEAEDADEESNGGGSSRGRKSSGSSSRRKSH